MINVIKGEPHRTMIICMDSFEQDVPKGRVYKPQSGEYQDFKSLIQLLSLAEENFERIDFPQGYLKMREFVPKKSLPPSATLSDKKRKGSLATFTVRLMFRQNASWQGAVSWLEGNSEETFRSALELIFLMKSAMDNAKTAAVI